jgi:NADPH:quinone reductase-like Zn-dependent oxidoreductase
MDYLSLLRPKTGTVISIATTPSGQQFQNSSVMRMPSRPTVPTFIRIVLNLIDGYRQWRASRWGVNYSFMFLDPIGSDLDFLRENIEKGKIKSIVGSTVDFNDIEALKKAAQVVYDGKGGVGKTVIKVAEK